MNLFDLSNTKVINSRYFKRQNIVWRRRRTPRGAVFTTRESVDLTSVKLQDNRGNDIAFSSAKLFLSLLDACSHLENATEVAWELHRTVEQKLITEVSGQLTIDIKIIVNLNLDTLKAYDTTAYVKYGALHPEIVSTRKLAATIS